MGSLYSGILPNQYLKLFCVCLNRWFDLTNMSNNMWYGFSFCLGTNYLVNSDVASWNFRCLLIKKKLPFSLYDANTEEEGNSVTKWLRCANHQWQQQGTGQHVGLARNWKGMLCYLQKNVQSVPLPIVETN